MKKLAFFLTALISLLFVVNVKADTTLYVGYDNEFNTIEVINNNLEVLANTRQYLLNTERISESDILVVQDAMWDWVGLQNPFYVGVVYQNVEINDSTSQVIFNYTGWCIEYDTTTKEVSTYSGYCYNSYGVNLSTPQDIGYHYWFGGNENTTLTITNNVTDTNLILDPDNQSSNSILEYGESMNLWEFAKNLMGLTEREPTYEYEETILESGNVRLDFTFSNYNSNGSYGFEIENGLSNEEYGIENTFSSIFPKIIPFGNSYSIEVPFDTILYVTLAKYEQVEGTSLYSREEIYTNMIDINNVVFENPQEPYFTIYQQTGHIIEGAFVNTKANDTCWYRYSTSQNEDFVPCNEILGLNFHDNGYAEVIIKRNNNTIYSRKLNYIGGGVNDPYIVYEINKMDFYSVINWHIQNEISNTTYRYSIDNGENFTNWENYNSNNNTSINVFDNSTIIIEIANSNQGTIYDSKAIVVVNDIQNIKNINNTTTNFINKFKSIFNINGNILNNVNNIWGGLKTSKLYLIIFIPFITSVICAIIYLIRRK